MPGNIRKFSTPFGVPCIAHCIWHKPNFHGDGRGQVPRPLLYTVPTNFTLLHPPAANAIAEVIKESIVLHFLVGYLDRPDILPNFRERTLQVRSFSYPS